MPSCDLQSSNMPLDTAVYKYHYQYYHSYVGYMAQALICQKSNEFAQESVWIEVCLSLCGKALGLKAALFGKDIAAENVVIRCGEGDFFLRDIAAVVFYDYL